MISIRKTKLKNRYGQRGGGPWGAFFAKSRGARKNIKDSTAGLTSEQKIASFTADQKGLADKFKGNTWIGRRFSSDKKRSAKAAKVLMGDMDKASLKKIASGEIIMGDQKVQKKMRELAKAQYSTKLKKEMKDKLKASGDSKWFKGGIPFTGREARLNRRRNRKMLEAEVKGRLSALDDRKKAIEAHKKAGNSMDTFNKSNIIKSKKTTDAFDRMKYKRGKIENYEKVKATEKELGKGHYGSKIARTFRFREGESALIKKTVSIRKELGKKNISDARRQELLGQLDSLKTRGQHLKKYRTMKGNIKKNSGFLWRTKAKRDALADMQQKKKNLYKDLSDKKLKEGDAEIQKAMEESKKYTGDMYTKNMRQRAWNRGKSTRDYLTMTKHRKRWSKERQDRLAREADAKALKASQTATLENTDKKLQEKFQDRHLKEAQKKIEENKKRMEEAKKQAEEAKKQAEAAKKAVKEAKKAPKAETVKPDNEPVSTSSSTGTSPGPSSGKPGPTSGSSKPSTGPSKQSSSTGSSSGSSKPVETKPGSSKPVETKPGSSKPSTGPSKQSSSTGSSSGSSKPVETKPGSSKPVKTKPGSSKQSSSTGSSPTGSSPTGSQSSTGPTSKQSSSTGSSSVLSKQPSTSSPSKSSPTPSKSSPKASPKASTSSPKKSSTKTKQDDTANAGKRSEKVTNGQKNPSGGPQQSMKRPSNRPGDFTPRDPRKVLLDKKRAGIQLSREERIQLNALNAKRRLKRIGNNTRKLEKRKQILEGKGELTKTNQAELTQINLRLKNKQPANLMRPEQVKVSSGVNRSVNGANLTASSKTLKSASQKTPGSVKGQMPKPNASIKDRTQIPKEQEIGNKLPKRVSSLKQNGLQDDLLPQKVITS